MKRLWLMCLFIGGVSVSSFAQGFQQQTPAEKAIALKTSLSLTNKQATKITVIYTTQKKSADSLLEASKGEYNTMVTKMIPIINTANSKIKAVLTTQQATIFQKKLDAQAERMRQMMQQGIGTKSAPPKQ